MFKLIRSLLGKDPSNSLAPEDFDVIKAEVEQILELDLSSDSSREEHGEAVLNVLHHLDKEIEVVRQQANGYPENAISAEIWMNGVGSGNLARALTAHFKKAGWLKREENASALRVKATLAVCSHYHHMVGPAMIENADCHDRLGNADRATAMYGGIVKDFAFIAYEWVNETDSPHEEDRIALESLQTAVERLLIRGINDLDGIDLLSIQRHTESILKRPQINKQLESS